MTESASPVCACAPGGSLENQPGTEPLCELNVGGEVLTKGRFPLFLAQQLEGGKVAQLDPFEEDESGLNAPIAEKQITVKLGQGTSKPGYAESSSRYAARVPEAASTS